MDYKDYYKILVVEKTVGKDELRNQYRKPARTHPILSEIIFGQGFRNATNESFARKGQDLRAELAISVEEAFYDVGGARPEVGEDLSLALDLALLKTGNREDPPASKNTADTRPMIPSSCDLIFMRHPPCSHENTTTGSRICRVFREAGPIPGR